MSAAGVTMSSPDHDSQVMNYLVRMVVPMRREFGRSLNVQQFMHDFAYAREVLEQAKTSADPRLLEYARYVEGRLRGPRIADQPAPGDPRFADTVAGAKSVEAPAAAPAGPSEQELRDRVMKKYTTGLR
jgi:hypothetical protein